MKIADRVRIKNKIINAMENEILLGDALDDERAFFDKMPKENDKIGEYFEIEEFGIAIVKMYYENGILFRHQTYKFNGEPLTESYPGYQKEYDENGTLRLEKIAKMNGNISYKEWYENGQISLEIIMGENVNIIREWDENGNLTNEI